VHLYNHLLAGARLARRQVAAPQLSSADATTEGGVVGPFRLHATHNAALTVSHGAIVNADRVELAGPFNPGAELYLRPQPGSGTVTVTAFVPATANGFGGQVITGVARDESNSRLTPVALALPAQLVVDFDIHWDETAPELAQRAG
jgi:hypothetical protein